MSKNNTDPSDQCHYTEDLKHVKTITKPSGTVYTKVGILNNKELVFVIRDGYQLRLDIKSLPLMINALTEIQSELQAEENFNELPTRSDIGHGDSQ